MRMTTNVKERNCCFVLIKGIINGAEKYDTKNKRSLDLSEYKKEGYLCFRKFAHFVSKFTANE